MATQQQESFRVLVIGDQCTDEYVYGNCTRLSPEAPVPVFVESERVKVRGMAGNVALNLEALGASWGIVCNTERITKTRFVDAATKSHLLRLDDEPVIKPLNMLRVLEKMEPIPDAIAIIDYEKGLITAALVRAVIMMANHHKISVFVDSKKRDASCFSGATVMKINESELLAMTNDPGEGTKLVVTMGSDGACYDGHRYIPPHVNVFDVCGAGDTFMAALVYAWLETGGDMTRVIPFANACASRAVQHFGTHVLTRQEVKELKERL